MLCALVSFQAAAPLPFAVEDSGLREGTTQALQVVLGPRAQEGACFNFSAVCCSCFIVGSVLVEHLWSVTPEGAEAADRRGLRGVLCLTV